MVKEIGSTIPYKIKLVGILHAREAKIIEAATAINPNPTVATRLAYWSFRRSTSIEDTANGMIRIPPDIATAISPCSGEMPRPKEHLSASMAKRLEATDCDAMAKKMKMPEMTAAFAARRAPLTWSGEDSDIVALWITTH